jgi:PAS domain S-box-containing protein
LQSAGIALAYYAAVQCGHQFVFLTKTMNAFWPAAGVAFATFAIFGYRAWKGILPGVFLGVLPVALGDFAFGKAAMIAVGNTLAYLLTFAAMRRTCRFEPALERPKDVAALVLFAGLMSSPLHALNSALWLGVPWSVWRNWWLSYFMGALLVAPVLLTWIGPSVRRERARQPLRRNPARMPEAAALFLLLAITCGLTFSGGAAWTPAFFRFEYCVFPILIWAALRFGQRAISASVLLIGLAAIWGALYYRGPFAYGSLEERIAALNVFLIVTAITALTLGAVTAEKDRGRLEIQRHLAEQAATEAALRKSEDRFRAIFDRAAVGICEAAPDGAFLRVNDGLCEMLGMTREDLLSRGFEDITHPDDLRSDREQTQALLRGEIARYTTEKRYIRRDLSIMWVQLAVSLVRGPSGDPDRFISVIEDTTARREAFDRVREAEERFRWLVDASPVGVVEARRDGSVEKANDAFYRIVGWNRAEFGQTGMDFHKLTPAGLLAKTTRDIDTCLENGNSAMYEREYLRRDGTSVPVLIAASVRPDRRDDLLVFVLDLSDQKQAEARLRRSEERLRSAQRAARAGIFDWNLRTGEREWSEEIYAQFGVPVGTPVSLELFLSRVAEEDRDRVADAVRTAIATGEPYAAEFRVFRDGEVAWLSGTGKCVFDESGPARFSGISVDITQRKMAEIALKASERQFRQLADAMPQIVWTSSPDGAVDYYNDKWYELTGFPVSLHGDVSWAPILHPDDLQLCLDVWYAAVRSGSPYEIQYRFWDRRVGSFRWYLSRALPLHDESGRIVKWVGTCTDIDEYKRLSEELELKVSERTNELRQSLDEKTTLLREVHHRVKNNLQVICSLLSMQIDCARLPSVSDSLLRALNRVQSMAMVHEQLYQTENLSRLDLLGYVEGLAGNLFQAYCLDPGRIELKLSVEPVEMTIDQAIPCGLILNELISNSMKHAFPAGRPGSLRVSLRRISEARLELLVADDGVGLPSSPQDNGSLGMRVVKALVGQLRADLRIDGRNGTRTVLTWNIA